MAHDYKVISDIVPIHSGQPTDWTSFEKQIKTAIQQGWEPLGGISAEAEMSSGIGFYRCVQALTK